MARRTGAQQTGRKIAERSRGGKQKSPKPRKTPRGATPRPKRAAVSAADGAEVIRKIRESSVERTGQNASRDETRVLGAPTGGHPSVPNSATFPPPGWCWTPGGIRLSLGALTIDAEQAEVEKGALKAMLSSVTQLATYRRPSGTSRPSSRKRRYTGSGSPSRSSR